MKTYTGKAHLCQVVLQLVAGVHLVTNLVGERVVDLVPVEER